MQGHLANEQASLYASPSSCLADTGMGRGWTADAGAAPIGFGAAPAEAYVTLGAFKSKKEAAFS